ncbi:hypothetical protein JANAI62_14540 [Jannaschia pagri]|uniref:Uncharacterized protein n=1 Tax=Jannaschia pagri TaxID=2829797 RepID=A0ABQ4NKG7_9RHOB|nr:MULTISPECIES: hypothetical protein [unclassified Jannaschia]GIT90999.1 hypothetical protein JANAI61_14570 [Jannaschia sp. AI_61]GIT94831.1 hypothetical protein JANAI62_14540 [Jannaschia sp. AI_62]
MTRIPEVRYIDFTTLIDLLGGGLDDMKPQAPTKVAHPARTPANDGTADAA